jgi:hypothetical protein
MSNLKNMPSCLVYKARNDIAVQRKRLQREQTAQSRRPFM